MVVRQIKKCFVTGIKGRVISLCLIIALLMVGCGEKTKTSQDLTTLPPEIDLGTTIGMAAEVFSRDTIAVEGYTLVGGLNGTGSAECPSQIRPYLEKYIHQQLLNKQIDAAKIISSPKTAVVRVHGTIPAAASKNERFDVQVDTLQGTQTTSLEGGWLWGAELVEAGKFGLVTKVLATAEGEIFTDTTGSDISRTSKKIGYVLGGGKVLNEYKISLALRRPDYRVVSRIRNRLNEHFGDGTAQAASPSQINLKVPPKYTNQKQRFISIVGAMYLEQTPEIMQERISMLIKKLAASESGDAEKEQAEIALEAIGNESVDRLSVLLRLPDELVRLRAARCMLFLGSDEGLETLREIAMDERSSNRIAALDAITAAANHNDAAAISRRLLRNEDFKVRLAAYEQLEKLDDISITRQLIADKFYLEQIAQTPYQSIFVTRSGKPKIVLFGAPIYCSKDIFVQSDDGDIIINAAEGQEKVSIMRKHPTRPDVIAKLESSFDLSDIIRTLAKEPLRKTDYEQVGLGISYSELIAFLKQMSIKGAIRTKIWAGPMPKINPNIKK